MKFYQSLILLIVLSYNGNAQTEREITGSLLSSEAPTIQFEEIGLQEGLSQSSGNSIMQDRNGFMWIATQGGLHRYNGYEFEVFNSVPFDTTSLSENWVWGATEAENGDLWVTTMGGGLNRLDPSTGKAIHYRHDPQDSSSISSDLTFFSYESKSGDLWVSTFRDGLNRMRAGEDGIFNKYLNNQEDSSTISSNTIYWITEDDQERIWAGSANGLNRIDPANDQIRRYLNNPELTPVYLDPLNVGGLYIPENDQETIWLATGNGLVKLEVESGDHSRFLIEPNTDGINPLNFLHEVRPDPNDPNVLWVGGPGTGIARFDIRTKQFSTYRADPGDKHSLSDNQVVSLYIDRSGITWAGTADEGLNKFNPGAVNFRHVQHRSDDPSGLPDGIVWGIFEDSQGSLWVGTSDRVNQNLTRFDGETRGVTKYKHDPNDTESLQAGNLWAFAEDEDGKFWVAGLRGLSQFNRETGKAIRHEWVLPDGNGQNAIFAIVNDRYNPNLLWVGTGRGLGLFNKSSGSFTSIPIAFNEENNTDPPVYSLLAGLNGKVWLGTSEGLYVVDSTREVALVSSYDPMDTLQINDDLIQCIVERESEPGILWLANSRGGGLNRYDTKARTARHFTMEDGLANNTVYGILEDNIGTLWMSTNAGISQFNPDTEEFTNYGMEDGLIALEYSQNAYFKGNDGKLYFGSIRGVTYFSPENLSINSTPPQVKITDLKISNESVVPGPDSPLKEPITKTERIELSYDQNEVSIEYVGLHFVNPAKNQYAYQLKGFDDNWVNAGSQRSATYTNLPPGEYTFQVKAANSDGVWNENGAIIQLSILSPWYRTWWAYLFFACFIGAFIFSVDRIQRQRISKKEKERATLKEAELRAEAENKRRSDTEELSKIGRAITSSLSIDKIIETVYENVNALMDASVFGVGIYNKEKNRLDFPATKEEGVMLPPYSNHLNETHWLSIVCFKNKKEIVISDFDKEYGQYLSSYTEPISGKSSHSIIYMPLIQQGRVIGVITTQSFNKNAYSEYHVNLLRNLANYAAIALDNASAYRKLNATQEQLVHAEKMASLGELTAGIAHEIQNPLNFVNNFSEINKELIEELKAAVAKNDKEEVKAIFDDLTENEGKVMHHGKRAEGIVKSMLQHSRTGSGEKELTDINALADEYLRLAYHGLRAKDQSFNADFKTEFDEKLTKIEVVPQDIGRVLLNLINNAFQAVKDVEKPEVIVSTIHVSPSGGGKRGVEITVKDNGPGIPDDIKEKIFQPFFTTKPTGEGTGLGLSMSYDIVTKGHGGTLEVDSKKGEGVEFIIRLPT